MFKKTLFSILFVFNSVIVFSQEKTSLASPYNTIYTHLYYLQTDSYKPAKSATTIYGDFSEKEKEDIAKKIKKVIDGTGAYIIMDDLPKENNYIDSATQKHVYYLTDKEPNIYLEKIDSNWYFSRYTINKIDELYNNIYPFWAKHIDNFVSYKLANKTFLSVSIVKYIASFLLILFSFFLYFLLKKIFFFITKKLTKRNVLKSISEEILYEISKAIALVLSFMFLSKAIPSIQLPLKFSILLVLISSILTIFFIAYLLNNLFKLVLSYFEKIADKTETKFDNQLLPILKTLGNFTIYFIAILYVLKELDINITAILAGLSIGGLAIALASKDTVQNIIGSLNIFLDRPFEIGDYIKIDGAEGVIEEVGLRATRIRTLDQSLAYVPNGILSNMTIDNFGLRIYRRWKTTFGLEYSTSPEKIKIFVSKTIEILNDNNNTLNDKTLVYFTNMGESTLDIYLSVFFDVKTFQEDSDCKQTLLLKILAMANENNIEFAFPSRTIYKK